MFVIRKIWQKNCLCVGNSVSVKEIATWLVQGFMHYSFVLRTLLLRKRKKKERKDTWDLNNNLV